jgi:DHA2 family multidrug resistance protein-like MFS transporter
MAPQDATGEIRATRRQWIGFAVLTLPTLIVSIDFFVLLLTLPHLSADLDANSTQQLWIMDIYGFMLAGFLITMGTLGDRIGRRKLLLIGTAAFGAASLIAAYSNGPEMLIISRALLGAAGATLLPSTLALISNMFRNPKQMGLAIGIWVGCFTVGAIVGPIIGGVMLENFWWGSVFLLGVPVMVLLLVIGPILLPEYRDQGAGRLDLPSVVISMAAVLPFIYGVKELARQGWDPVLIGSVVVGLVFGVLFVRRQLRLADPLVDLSLFKNRAFSSALVGMLCFSGVGAATLTFLSLYFQSVEGWSPMQAALGLVPGMAVATFSFTTSPLLARRVRPGALIFAGLLVTVAGYLLMTQASATSGALLLVTGFAVSSLGSGPIVGLGTNLVLASAPPEKAGSAGSINQSSTEFGTSLGIAMVGTIGTAVYRAQIDNNIPADVPADAAEAARESIVGAAGVATTLPGQVGDELLAQASEAFTTGLHTVVTVAAGLILVVAVVILIQLRHVPPLGQEQQTAPDPDPSSRPTEPVGEPD